VDFADAAQISNSLVTFVCSSSAFMAVTRDWGFVLRQQIDLVGDIEG
jgi:hypothetical protein